MNEAATPHPQLGRIPQRALVVGAVGLALCLGGAALSARQFFQSYLPAYLFWIGISLGCFAVVMLHHLVGGLWGFLIRRPLEAGMRTLPLMAVLFLPLLLGLQDLYLWAQPQAGADELLRHKGPYLNVPFFIGRAIFYFAAWITFASLLNRWSQEQDRTADPSLTRRLQLLSGPGLVVYGLTVTFSAIDWVMSLEPHWFSAIYGMLFMVSYGLGGLAFVIIVAALLAGQRPLARVASPANFHDLGNLLLAFVMLWAYMGFSQFLIIWVENLPEEIPWYLHRTAGGWQGVALALIALQFALPFVLLLSRATKRSVQMLMGVAVLILFMRLVDLFWLVTPAFHPTGLRLHWMDVVAPLGIGGIWIFVFTRSLQRRPLLPVHDPRLAGALEHTGGG